MLITTKAKANEMLVNSLFTTGSTLNVEKFSSIKLKWKGKVSAYLGEEVIDIKGVVAVYVVRRSDKNGPYGQMMCVCI